jgi:hypothetical protein
MAFSDETIKQAWQKSGGRCECKRSSHDHLVFSCSNELIFENRGREGSGTWEAHHINSMDGDSLSNCEILCWSCLKKAQSLGG